MALGLAAACGDGRSDVATPLVPLPNDPGATPSCAPLDPDSCCAALCAATESAGCRTRLGIVPSGADCEPDEVADECVTSATGRVTWRCRPANPGEVVADCDGDGVPNDRDCAPCDELRFDSQAAIYSDADGDGHLKVESPICVGAVLPDGLIAGPVDSAAIGDCEPEDAERWQFGCLDADADGWCVDRSTDCVGDPPPPGYRLGTEGRARGDCDDGDATLQEAGYADADGDGSRADASAPSRCFPAGALEPGFEPAPGSDCDDMDPRVFPEQVEFLDDGVDANCDGSDVGPCPAAGDGTDPCACWPAACDATTTCADGVDLAAVSVIPGVATGPARQAAAVLVVNRGGVPFEGSVVVSAADFYGAYRDPYCWFDTELALELSPGEGRALAVDPLCQAIRLDVLGGEDCEPANDGITFRTELGSGDVPVVATTGGASPLPASSDPMLGEAPPAVLARDLGPEYSFVIFAPGYDPLELLIGAEGDGPPQLVTVHGCESLTVLSLPEGHAGWHWRALGSGGLAADGPLAVACDAEACRLFDGSDAAATGELHEIAGSELPLGEWTTVFHRTATVRSAEAVSSLCVESLDARRCFDGAAWSAPEPGPFGVERALAVPACDGITLMTYADRLGATADGELVVVNVGAALPDRCTMVTEPLGEPLGFFTYYCGIAATEWLVTADRLQRGVNGRGCDCPID